MGSLSDEDEAEVFEQLRREDLVARAALLPRLDRLLIGDGGDRWVVVTGSRRAGMSALLGAWLARREAAGDAVPHLSAPMGEDGWTDLAELVGSLVTQIEERFGRGEPDADARAHPAERLAATLARVSVSALVPRGERLVVLIEGLDEHYARDEVTGDSLAELLPRALPRGVSFLCSCESGHPYVDALAAREGELVWLELDDEIRSSLDVRGGRSTHDWVRWRWRNRSSRNEVLWDQIALSGEVRVGLGLLCAAREALSLEVLAELARWGPEQQERFLRKAPWVQREEPAAWGGAAAYGLRPDGMREWIAEQLGEDACRTYHRWLSQRLATWPPRVGAAARRYALRHALFHRVEAGDWVDAWRLAADLGFLEARCRELGVKEVQADVARAGERCREHGGEALARRFDDLARALAREAPRLRAAPEAVAALVWNRLRRSGWSEDELDAQLRVPPDAAFLRLRYWTSREASAPAGGAAGHARRVSACALTPDGRCVVSASDDRTLKVWDVERGQLLVTLDKHASWVNGCAVTPDGRRAVAALEDGTLKVWDLDSGYALATLEGHAGAVRACAVTPDGWRLISASDDGTLKVWTLQHWRVLATLEGHAGWVRACAVTPDGRRVVSGSYDRTLKIWDLDSGYALATLEGHTHKVSACAVTPDGRHVISASADGTLKVWGLEDGRVLATLDGHAGEVRACAVTPDGRRVISASADRTLKVWDLDTRDCLFTHHGDAAHGAVAATATGVIAGDDAGALWFLRWPPSRSARGLHELVASDWQDPAPVLRVVDSLVGGAAAPSREISLDEIRRVSSAPGLAESLRIAEYLASERIGLLVTWFKLADRDGATVFADEAVYLALRTGVLRDPRTGDAIADWQRRVVLSYRTAVTAREEG